MKKLLLSSLFIFPLFICGPLSAQAETVWIQVRETKLRSQPLFYAPGSKTLKYGDSATKLSEEKGWTQVSVDSTTGYIPTSALSRDTIVLTARDVTKVHAEAGEVVLAGKGFSKEVEKEYRAQNSEARYDLVDRIERSNSVPTATLPKFIKAGGLK